MNEYIQIKLRRNNKPLRINRQVPGGIELNEPDPIERTVYIGFDSADEITEYRMRRIRQLQGWDPVQFKLTITVEDGAIVLRGIDKHSLPEGRYRIVVNIEEAKTAGTNRTVSVPHDGSGSLDVKVETDDRELDVDLTDCDPVIKGILDRSKLDEEDAAAWLEDETWRPARKACLLNLLASLRVRPTVSDNLAQYVREVFWIVNDRAYAKVDRTLFDRFQDLAVDPQRPFYREGYPKADIHLRLLDRIPEPPDRKALFPRESLVSFRGEGRPSLQAVIATPPGGIDYTYADLDLDLGNPLQDLVGFVVHMGELVKGQTTNHLDLRKLLVKGAAKQYLYYTIDSN
jgi:hypothetical protein